MQEGQDILVVDRAGTARPGKVAAVVGSGPSGYKTLHVKSPDGSIEQNVPHGNDRAQEPGRNFWLLPSEPIPTIESAGYSPLLITGMATTTTAPETDDDVEQ